jgi:hypothetical protein
MANKLSLSKVMLRLITFQDAGLDDESTIACWRYALKTSGWTLEEFVLQCILHEIRFPLDMVLLRFKPKS